MIPARPARDPLRNNTPARNDAFARALRLLVALLPEPILLLHPDGGIDICNAEFADRLGHTVPALAGRAIGEVVASPAAQLEVLLRRWGATRRSMAAGLLFRAADGRTIHARCEGGLMQDGGDPAKGFILLRCQEMEAAGGGDGTQLVSLRLGGDVAEWIQGLDAGRRVKVSAALRALMEESQNRPGS